MGVNLFGGGMNVGGRPATSPHGALRMSSASAGATEEDVRGVLEGHGLEIDEPEERQEAPKTPTPVSAAFLDEEFHSVEDVDAFDKRKVTPQERLIVNDRMGRGWQEAVERFKEHTPDFDEKLNRDYGIWNHDKIARYIRLTGNAGLLFHFRDAQFREQINNCNSWQEQILLLNHLHHGALRPPDDEGYTATNHGPVLLRSPRQAPPSPSRAERKGTAAAAAQRGDYQTFKRLSKKANRGARLA